MDVSAEIPRLIIVIITLIAWRNIVQRASRSKYNFSEKMFLKVSLGPMHLWGRLINEASAYDNNKTFIWKENKIRRLLSTNLNESTAMANYEKGSKNKPTFIYFYGIWTPLLIRTPICQIKTTVCYAQSPIVFMA